MLHLRPLPLGELLDRAFHIYFRHVAAFTGLVAVVLIPTAIAQYFQTKDIFDVYLSMIQQAMHSPATPPDPSKLARLHVADSWTFIALAIVFLGFPLSNAAVVLGVTRAYLGLPVRFAECYRMALKRWFRMIILLFVWIAVVVVGLFALVLVMGALSAVIVAAGAFLRGTSAAAVLLAVFLVVVGIVTIGVMAMLYLAFALSFIALVVEKSDPIKAFASAFSRIFGGKQAKRAFALAITLILVNFAAQLLGAGSGMLLAYYGKSPALYVILASLAQMFFYPFAIVAVSVFYYDIRIRREGFDLQILMQRLTESPAQLPPVAT
ncbi:MAG: hypothetical protein DLM53_03555 [Candidatus Eremiobacter antarcticus]|nr:hypothetical protein [Candidatus Eremiobacteraeota bacterium]MBC5807349.1 hypothetical protein [Candidatus Eremiobacteraeota bacterium]PZR63102.1 MAG: hypothetical protein DLM53_03555 [Candidatus Eremiobacter sp. RRmetagenome_bin22]